MHYFRILRSPVSILVALTMTAHSTAMASPKPLELRWSELSSRIQDRTIELTLPGGTTVGGNVVLVREESIVLNIHKTSDERAYPKGNATIPKASVTVMNLKEVHGQWGRKMGTSLGGVAGVLLGGYTAAKSASSAGSGLAIFGAITGSGILAGYYLGKSADSRDTLIRVVP